MFFNVFNVTLTSAEGLDVEVYLLDLFTKFRDNTTSSKMTEYTLVCMGVSFDFCDGRGRGSTLPQWGSSVTRRKF